MTNKRGAVSSNCHLDKKQLIRLWLELLKNTGEIERYLRTQLRLVTFLSWFNEPTSIFKSSIFKL